eukprot:3331666-Rhodomonas_salina.3
MAGKRSSRNTVLLLSYAAVGCIAMTAIVLFVDGGAQERYLMQSGGAIPVQAHSFLSVLKIASVAW